MAAVDSLRSPIAAVEFVFLEWLLWTVLVLQELLLNEDCHTRPDDLNLLLSTDNFFASGPIVLLSIQVNEFSCGGMAIGICISHKVADASSLSLFINTWAALTKGEEKNIPQPKFLLNPLFPPAHDSSYTLAPQIPTGIISKRFVFNKTNIAALKAKCPSNLHVEQPTRVESVFALIWKCCRNVVRAKAADVSSLAYLIVNLRERIIPPLSKQFVGNLVFGIPTGVLGPEPHQDELQFLLGKLRAVKKIAQGDYIRNIQSEDGFSACFKSIKEMGELHEKGELEIYTFTSWCRFPFYEADFGWGHPVLAVPANFASRNLITLMDTKDGKGVEAWITMDEEDMVRFEREDELIAFVSSNPTG